MKKQWIKLSVTVSVIGGFMAAMALGSSPAANVMGTQAKTLTFAAQTGMPSPDKGAVTADDSVMQGMFTGDYMAAGIKGVGFRVNADKGSPSTCVLYFYNSANNREWYFPVTAFSDSGADWVPVTVPFDYAAGWALWDSGATPEMFYADLQGVDQIGLRFLRKGTDQSTYKVDSFVLIGGMSYGTGQALYNFMVANGITDVNAISGHGGLSNLGVFLAGLDPKDLSSTFLVQIALQDNPKAVVLKWSNNNPSAVKFAVWKMADKSGQYVRKTTAGTWIESKSAEVVVPVTDDGIGPNFYKVELSGK